MCNLKATFLYYKFLKVKSFCTLFHDTNVYLIRTCLMTICYNICTKIGELCKISLCSCDFPSVQNQIFVVCFS